MTNIMWGESNECSAGKMTNEMAGIKVTNATAGK